MRTPTTMSGNRPQSYDGRHECGALRAPAWSERLSLDRVTRSGGKAAERSAVAYMVLRFPLVTETFVLRELNAVADRVAFPVELFALRPGRGGPVHPMANRWLPVVQIASIARGCVELMRLAVTRPRVVLRGSFVTWYSTTRVTLARW